MFLYFIKLSEKPIADKDISEKKTKQKTETGIYLKESDHAGHFFSYFIMYK